MRILRITDSHDLRELFRFRHEIFVDELGWLFPSGSQMLHDEFDKVSLNYAAIDDAGAIIGSIRLVIDSALGLPLENCFKLNGYRNGREVAELSRLAVSKRYRGSHLTALLMKAGYQCARHNSVTHLVVDTYINENDDVPALFTKMGFEALSEPYEDKNYRICTPVVPLSLDLRSAEDEKTEMRNTLHRFFIRPDERISHSEDLSPKLIHKKGGSSCPGCF